MLNRASKPFVKLVERYLPDPYIFVLLLTLITLVFAVVIQDQSPLATVQQWGDGFWGAANLFNANALSVSNRIYAGMHAASQDTAGKPRPFS